MRVIRVRKEFGLTGWSQERHAAQVCKVVKEDRKEIIGDKEQRGIRAWGQVGAGSYRGQKDIKWDRQRLEGIWWEFSRVSESFKWRIHRSQGDTLV